MATLYIRLLGDFQVTCDETLVTELNGSRLQALLTFLVLHRDRAQSRQQLAFRLWPDSTETQARTNLRYQLHMLRRALPDADRYLQSDAHTVQWQSLNAEFWLDVAEFESALAGANQAQQGGDLTTLHEQLERAIGLYGGDLLTSCYDDWIVPERERLHQAVMHALEQLVSLLEHQANYRVAIEYAEQLLHLDPLHEATYRHLMRLNALSGDRSEVLRVYRACAKVMKRELEVEPSPLTRETYQQLISGEGPTVQTSSPTPATHQLPVPLTSFIGREHEKIEIMQLLTNQPSFTALSPSEHRLPEKAGGDSIINRPTRLLTLTGSGGCGKTRLALQVAHELFAAQAWMDGVWWVELAAISNPVLVPQVIANVLGVREQPGQALTETLIDYLRSRKLLLILDNCEHLSETCARLAESLLGSCPNLWMLVTSRQVLNIAGETVWIVPSLARPASEKQLSPEELLEYDAIRLFVERARNVLPTFQLTIHNAAAVVQICQRLDGMPLAIELAAARTNVLAVEQISARLDDRFNLLTKGRRTALQRYQTLREAIEWSYELLSMDERVLFRRLSTFAGGFTLAAAEAVGSSDGLEVNQILDLLSHLIDKSLVSRQRQRGEARYQLLETIRQYGQEQLEASSERAATQERHAGFFLALAEQARPKLEGSDQALWLDRLEQEHNNLRAALHWFIEQGALEQGLRLGSALWLFWVIRGYLVEGREQLGLILAQTDAATQLPARAEALNLAGILARYQGDYAAAYALISESLTICRKLGDPHSVADSLANLGFVTLHQENYTLARALYMESLEINRQINNEQGIADSLSHVGLLAFYQEQYMEAQTMAEESLAIWRKLGDQQGIAWALHRLGDVFQKQGHPVKARRYFTESLQISNKLGYRWGIAWCLEDFAHLAIMQNAPEHSVQLAAAAEAWRGEFGMPLPPPEREQLDRTLNLARQAMSQEAFTVAWKRGRTLTLEQAVEYALMGTAGS